MLNLKARSGRRIQLIGAMDPYFTIGHALKRVRAAL